MIYAIAILSALLFGALIWIMQLKEYAKWDEKELARKEETIDTYKKAYDELSKDISTLINGGLCEQEAIQMKYQKKWDEEKKGGEFALFAAKRQQEMIEQAGGNYRRFQPRY